MVIGIIADNNTNLLSCYYTASAVIPLYKHGGDSKIIAFVLGTLSSCHQARALKPTETNLSSI